MRLLLDTNVFLRWMGGIPLPRAAERALNRADTECLISVVSAWEIAIKPKLGISSADTEAAVAALGAALLPIRFSHLNELSRLPDRGDHRDPFDRMLIAQALAEEVPVVTGDTRFQTYKRLRVLWD